MKNVLFAPVKAEQDCFWKNVWSCQNHVLDLSVHLSMSSRATLQGGPKKTDPHFYFWDNFGNSAPILTILSLLQAEIYGA